MRSLTPVQVKTLIGRREELALIDVRERFVHGSGHPLLSVNIPLSRMELRFAGAVPRRSTPVVLFDGGEGFAETAAARLERFGYTDVAVMSGGVDGWAEAGYELFPDQRVIAKGFSAFVERHTSPEFITAEALKLKLDHGEDLVVLDARPAAEYGVSNIPGSIDVPGPDLVRRFDDLVPSPETLVVVNCMSRTRGILGAVSLARAGVANTVMALENGTSGWRVAGLDLEQNAHRFAPPLSDKAQTNAQARAARLAAEANVSFIDEATLSRWQQDDARTLYVVDVRDAQAFREGHLPGSISVPAGGIILHPDEVAATMNARMVLVDDDGIRATVTAYWVEQIGLYEVAVLRPDWEDTDTESGVPSSPILGLEQATASRISADAAAQRLENNAAWVVDLGPSASYRQGHIPGAYFAIRAYLGDAVDALPSSPAPIILTSPDGILATLAAPEAGDLSRRPIAVLEGGTEAWKRSGRPLQSSPERMLSPEHDRLPRAHERPGDLRSNLSAYLEWETNLLAQIEKDGSAPYRSPKGA